MPFDAIKAVLMSVLFVRVVEKMHFWWQNSQLAYLCEDRLHLDLLVLAEGLVVCKKAFPSEQLFASTVDVFWGDYRNCILYSKIQAKAKYKL